ncbi:MAG: Ig-like domain repeat protein [Methanobrevibacter sp.]|uniref:Ig-like domain-containing protein n=1 Tax=Methanobrevibacter sp. TaxID=66852 RepID=UPI0025DA00DF|nr:Ig-like domain-containing protein [Methanobrevibacter sp.]MBQ8017821.1 Ig-like domain repeat protein [Methanobrevibacter sp.]
MNIKHLIIVSLILAILTIGAVSASEVADEIAIDDSSSDVDIIAQDGEEEDSDDISVVVDEYDVDDEPPYVVDTNKNSSEIAYIEYAPKDSTGRVTVLAGEDESETLMDKSIQSLTYDDDFDTFLITLNDLNRVINEDSLFITVKYFGADNNLIDSDNGTVKFENLSGYDEPADNPNAIYIEIYDVDEDGEPMICYLEEDYFASVELPSDAQGNITVYIKGKGYVFNKNLTQCSPDEDYNTEGRVKYLIWTNQLNPTLEKDDYEITVSYVGGNYGDVNESSTVRFESREDHVVELFDESDFNMGLKDEEIAYINVDKINGTVKVFIDGKEYLSKVVLDEEDYYSVSVDFTSAGVTIGNHTVKVTYATATKTYEKEAKINFVYPPVFDYFPSISVGEKDTILITGYKGATGTATLYTIDDEGKLKEFKSVNVVDGSAKIVLDNLTEGYYNFYINATIAGEYADSNIGIEVRNNTKGISSSVTLTDITVGEKVTVIFAGNKTLIGYIDIYVDNKEYKEEIKLVNGSMSYDITGLSVGTHDVSVKYWNEEGGDVFYSNTFSVKVNAKQAPIVKPPVKKDVIKLTLKKVKVKKSAKKLVLQATLKINKKAKKGLKVIFKFNGKKYTAKTNKKGVAKVTIKKKVLKKLKVGKKVKIQVSYGKTVKKLTVKVKK